MAVFFSILLYGAVVLAAVVGNMVFSFHASDAAGQGLTKTFAVIASIVLWLMLGGLIAMCGRSRLAILFFAAAIGHFVALLVLERMESGDRFETLLRIVTLAGPYLIILYCAWNYFEFLRKLAPSIAVDIAVGVTIAIVAAIPWIVKGPTYAASKTRNDARFEAFTKQQAEQKALIAAINQLPADAPVSSYLQYIDLPGGTDSEARQRALSRIRDLPSRGRDAEQILNASDTRLMRNLEDFQMDMTPGLCVASRKCLRKLSDELKPGDPAPPFDDSVNAKFEGYVGAIRWMLKGGCECKDEVAAFEQTVRLYPESFPRRLYLNYLAELQGKPRTP